MNVSPVQETPKEACDSDKILNNNASNNCQGGDCDGSFNTNLEGKVSPTDSDKQKKLTLKEADQALLNMGKNTDGDDVVTESACNENPAGQSVSGNNNDNDNEKVDSQEKEIIEMDNKSNASENVNEGMNQDRNQNVNQDTNQDDLVQKTLSVEIKDKSPKPHDDVNHFDSVSNIKSQPDKEHTKENRKDVRIVDSKFDIQESNLSSSQSNQVKQPSTPKLKKMKKAIFISYSPDAGFLERRFVVETVRQLKENNLAEDIWFDKDEKNTDSPCWFSMRMEAVEKCRAAILIVSESYFTCPVSLYEGKTLAERQNSDPNSVKVFTILFRPIDNIEVPKHFSQFTIPTVDLTLEHAKKSSAEKTSVVIGSIMEQIEKHASIHTGLPPVSPPDSEFTGEYKNSKICQWTASDLQEWLFHLGIKEFYRQSLAEAMVDGFLLMSLTDHDMIAHLGIESRVVRKKIMQQILQTLDKEHKQLDNWHLRARAQRSKPDVVYLIYDPADVRLAQNVKADLRAKNVQVSVLTF